MQIQSQVILIAKISYLKWRVIHLIKNKEKRNKKKENKEKKNITQKSGFTFLNR